MVGMGILRNNTRFPSPEYYTTFWRMTIYSATLHWWDITPMFDPLLIWTLLSNLTFYLILWGFHRTFATGATCQQRTLTPPDTWSCPILGLACVLVSRPISPELVLFPEFWVSNIHRYFCFAPYIYNIAQDKDIISSYIKSRIGLNVSLYLINQNVKKYDTVRFSNFTSASNICVIFWPKKYPSRFFEKKNSENCGPPRGNNILTLKKVKGQGYGMVPNIERACHKDHACQISIIYL